MPSATFSEDTEITLGTGKMLALFFGLVALCAVFFAFGFSLGKTSVLKPTAAETTLPSSTISASVRPSAVKNTNAAPPPADANTTVVGPGPDAQPATASAPEVNPPATQPTTAPPDPAAPPALNGYYVQVAAVSKQEDADALVDALKKKNFPAFSATTAADKLFHVQVGPYSEIKDAEGMRAKLVSDGYNPILKK